MNETFKDLLVLIMLLACLTVGMPFAIVGTAHLMGIDMGYWHGAFILIVIIVMSKVISSLEDLI